MVQKVRLISKLRDGNISIRSLKEHEYKVFISALSFGDFELQYHVIPLMPEFH